MIKHYFKRNGSQWLRVMLGIGGRPELHYANEDSRPYWKNFGTGAEHLDIETEYNGRGFLLRASNEGEEGKGRKETWVHLDKETAAKVAAFLQGRGDVAAQSRRQLEEKATEELRIRRIQCLQYQERLSKAVQALKLVKALSTDAAPFQGVPQIVAHLDPKAVEQIDNAIKLAEGK